MLLGRQLILFHLTRSSIFDWLCIQMFLVHKIQSWDLDMKYFDVLCCICGQMYFIKLGFKSFFVLKISVARAWIFF